MAFLNSLLLWGGLAVAAPILIHLLMRRKIVPVQWAAMKFLLASVQKTRKRLRLEDLLLLLLRCLLVLLLALALARPACRGDAAAALAQGREIAVIIVDNSYSMSVTDGSKSRFDKARTAAEEIVSGLPGGSEAAVFFVSDVVKTSIPEPTVDLNLARKVIRDGELTDRATDYAAAIRIAVETLERRSEERRTVYLVSDGQAEGWKRIRETADLLNASGEIQFVPVRVGDVERQNLAVTAVRLASAMAPTNRAVRFEVEVTNYGEGEVRNVPVSLALDGGAASDEATIDSISPAAAKSVSLYGRFDEPGYHTVEGALPPDRLPADDSRTLALRAIEEAPILLVNGEPGDEAREDETFFLWNALSPVPQTAREDFFLKPEVITPAELSTARLSGYDAVILANITDLSDAVARMLQQYVSRGGGLLIFPGDRVNSRFYNDVLADEHRLLPAKLGEQWEDAEGRQFAAAPYDHPIPEIWNDPASGTLTSARSFAGFDLTPVAGEEGEAPVTILSFQDGGAALMEKPLGDGRVMLFSSSADSEWNDLPVRPAFVPLVHRMLGAVLAEQDSSLNLPVGGDLLLKLPSGLVDRDMTITLPGSGDETRLRRVTILNNQPVLRFDETDRAGTYVARSDGDSPTTIRFAVQANRAESNLRPVEPAQLAALTGGDAPEEWTDQTDLAGKMQKARTGTEIWMPLLLAALAIVAAESVLADRFSRAK